MHIEHALTRVEKIIARLAIKPNALRQQEIVGCLRRIYAVIVTDELRRVEDAYLRSSKISCDSNSTGFLACSAQSKLPRRLNVVEHEVTHANQLLN